MNCVKTSFVICQPINPRLGVSIHLLMILSWGASASQVITTAIVAVSLELGGGTIRGPQELAMKKGDFSILAWTVVLSESLPIST